ncbi:MAG: PEP-CTERM sorting domain-containing protein [Sedimentisphaerales bacterium]|nr:PEP-CTERM sorting domain-containing protein [Sedimentisphaerales bacterium]
MFRSRFFTVSVVLLSLFTSSSLATVSTVSHGYFNLNFYNTGDSNGSETGQANWTAEQMADVVASTNAWSSGIANVAGRQIEVDLFWNELDVYGPTVLGGSGSYRVADGTTIWNLGEYVWKEETDPGTSTPFDTIIQYDITAAGVAWNFGTDAPGAGEIDFRSVVTHELGHSLGWDSSFDNDYNDWGWFSTGYGGLTAWDKNLVDSAGNRAQSGSSGTPGDFNQTDNPVFFDGANATTLNGGLVPIFAPNPWQPGSSLSHVDEGLLGSLLMSPSISTGELNRSVSDLEWAMMMDMGWTIVPEPATLVLLGLGGLIVRKRRI